LFCVRNENREKEGNLWDIFWFRSYERIPSCYLPKIKRKRKRKRKKVLRRGILMGKCKITIFISCHVFFPVVGDWRIQEKRRER